MQKKFRRRLVLRRSLRSVPAVEKCFPPTRLSHGNKRKNKNRKQLNLSWMRHPAPMTYCRKQSKQAGLPLPKQQRRWFFSFSPFLQLPFRRYHIALENHEFSKNMDLIKPALPYTEVIFKNPKIKYFPYRTCVNLAASPRSGSYPPRGPARRAGPQHAPARWGKCLCPGA